MSRPEGTCVSLITARIALRQNTCKNTDQDDALWFNDQFQFIDRRIVKSGFSV